MSCYVSELRPATSDILQKEAYIISAAVSPDSPKKYSDTASYVFHPQTYQQTQPSAVRVSDQSGMKPVSQQQSNKKIKWYLVSLQPKGHLDTGKSEVNPVS